MTFVPPVGALLGWALLLSLVFGVLALLTWPAKGQDYGGSPLPPAVPDPHGTESQRERWAMEQLDKRIAARRHAEHVEQLVEKGLVDYLARQERES